MGNKALDRTRTIDMFVARDDDEIMGTLERESSSNLYATKLIIPFPEMKCLVEPWAPLRNLLKSPSRCDQEAVILVLYSQRACLFIFTIIAYVDTPLKNFGPQNKPGCR